MASEISDDLYALLGIEAGIEAEELRQVWRRLARRWHPDHVGPQGTAMFQKISAAYAVLSDPVARAAYDRRRGVGTARAPGAGGVRTAAAAASTGARRRAPSVMLSRLSGPLNSLLACGIARHAEEGLIDLSLIAAEATQGGMITISMRVKVRKGTTIVEELFSAWLAVAPGAVDGDIVTPSVSLPGMIQPVRFRLRVPAGNHEQKSAPQS